MSVRVMALVWDSTVPAPERFTLLALADRADEDGKCWPSIPTLARKCCTGESTVRRHLTALKKQGVVTVEQRWNASSMYTIDLPKLRDLAQPTPSQSDTPPSQSDRGSQSDTPLQSERTPSQIGGGPPPNLSGPPSQSERLSIIDPSVDPSENHQGGARKRARRATRIPDNFVVTPEMVAWARREFPHIDGRRQTELFVDHFRAAPGQKGLKLDWTATWRNWIRKADEISGSRAGRLRSVPAQLPTDPAAALADLRRRADAQEAARLINALWIEPPQPPSDPTPPQKWARQRAIEFIDAHERELLTALDERKTG